ncbi:MAG: protein phosphatase 2C domain-containing protein [Nannocystaceae bacterium]
MSSSTYDHAIVSAACRRSSEDRASVAPIEGGLLLAVADGAGGSGGGARAAALAVAALEQIAGGGRLDPPDLCAALRAIDASIAADSEAGETTALVGVVRGGLVHGAAVGNSGIRGIRGDRVVDPIDPPPQRRPLLGSGGAVPAPFDGMSAAGTILVATDGLLDYLPSERLASPKFGASARAIAEALIAAVRLPSGGLHDDVTVIVCRLDRPDGRGRTSKDVEAAVVESHEDRRRSRRRGAASGSVLQPASIDRTAPTLTLRGASATILAARPGQMHERHPVGGGAPP